MKADDLTVICFNFLKIFIFFKKTLDRINNIKYNWLC